MKRATNIDELAKVLMPSKPLTREDEEFYVPLYEEELIEIRDRILHEDIENQTFYIAGQPGVGKTTALNFLVDEEIEAQYEVVRFDENYIPTPDTAPFIDFALWITSIILKNTSHSEFKAARLKLRSSCLQAKVKLYDEDTHHTIAGLINDVFTQLNYIIYLYKKLICKERKLLLVFDGISKLDLNKISLIETLEFIERLNCKKVVSSPVHIIQTSTDFTRDRTRELTILSTSNDFYQLLSAGNLKEAKEHRLFISFIMNRIVKDRELVTEKAIERAIEYSGGLVQQFQSILYRATVNAKANRNSNITEDNIEEAIKKLSVELNSTLNFKNRDKFLEGMIKEGNTYSSEIILRHLPDSLLNNQLILYINEMGRASYFINPLISPPQVKLKQEKRETTTINKTVQNTYLKNATLEDFFYIEEIKLDDLTDKREIYFVGENGDGKTLLLQALLMALKGSSDVGELVDFKNGNPHRESCYLQAVDSEGNEFTFTENYRRKNIGQNVFAYGVNRGRSDSEKKDSYGYMTLFNRESYMGSPVRWLQQLDYREKSGETGGITLEIAKGMLEEILVGNIEIEVSAKGVKFKERESEVTFEQLSDGYRSVLIWVCDLIERLSEVQPEAKKLEEFKGIVLIDEIELFLHPNWKYRVVRDLRSWFPGIQFILTTHSPTVILGASEDAVFYKVYKEEGKTRVVKPLNKIAGWMSNILLTSPLFDMESARSAATKGPEEVDTSNDYLSSKIHAEIRERIKGRKDVTDQEILDLIKGALDRYEEGKNNG